MIAPFLFLYLSKSRNFRLLYFHDQEFQVRCILNIP